MLIARFKIHPETHDCHEILEVTGSVIGALALKVRNQSTREPRFITPAEWASWVDIPDLPEPSA